MEEFSVPDDMIEKIKVFIREGRFKDLSDFFTQAARLLIYAEENKDQFTKVLKKEPENEKIP